MHRRRLITFTILASVWVCCSATFARTQTQQSGTAANAPALPGGKAGAGAFRFVALGDTGTGGAGQLAVARQLVTFNDERPFDTALILGGTRLGRPRGARGQYVSAADVTM
jgi:hypothetical protein